MKQHFYHNIRFQTILLPAGLLLFNFILRSLFLGNQPIANDEPFTIYHAQLQLPFLVSELSHYNNPPGFEILLHYWIKIFGIGSVSVRFLPMVFSSLAAFVLYHLGRKFFNFRIGLIAALLFTFSNYQGYFAHEARVYSLFVLLSLISMYGFFSLAGVPGNRRQKLIIVISNTLLLYVHFFGFWIILVQFLCVLGIKTLRQRFLKDYLLIFLVPLLLFLPYLNIFLDRLLQSASHGTWVRPPKGIFALFDLVRTFMNEAYGSTMLVKPVLTVFALLLIVLSFANFIRNKSYQIVDKKNVILVTWFFFPLLSIFLLSYFVPMLIDRYMVFISPAFFLLIALSLENIHKSVLIRQVAAAILLCLMILTSNPNPDNHRDIRGVVAKIKEIKSKENTLVYISPEWFDLNFVYYYRPEWFKEADNRVTKGLIRAHLHDDRIYPVFTSNEIDTLQTQKAERIIFLDAGASFSIPDNNIFEFLNAHYKLIRQTDYPEIFKIYEFEKH